MLKIMRAASFKVIRIEHMREITNVKDVVDTLYALEQCFSSSCDMKAQFLSCYKEG